MRVLISMRKFLAAAWEVCEVVFVAVATVFIIRAFIVQPFYVSGASMEPSFDDGNYLLIDEITPRFTGFVRGQVVVFRPPVGERTYYIKRIIGLPGERVAAADGHIRISTAGGETFTLDEPYVDAAFQSADNFQPVTLGADQYFVLGDNRTHSYDSRNWGAVGQTNIIGTVRVRLWPLKEFGIFTAPVYAPES